MIEIEQRIYPFKADKSFDVLYALLTLENFLLERKRWASSSSFQNNKRKGQKLKNTLSHFTSVVESVYSALTGKSNSASTSYGGPGNAGNAGNPVDALEEAQTELGYRQVLHPIDVRFHNGFFIHLLT